MPSKCMAIKKILKNFELLSGLKINYNKCCLMGMNVSEHRIQEMAEVLGCVIGEVPFLYLGIRVGASYKKPSEWDAFVQKFQKKMKSWEDQNISFGGRVTLLNAVLSSLSIY